MTLRQVPDGLGRLTQREGPVDRRCDLPLLDQRGQEFQVFGALLCGHGSQPLAREHRPDGCSQDLAVGEQHLRAILSEYIGHYNTGRSHQGDGMGLRAPDDPGVIAFRVPPTQIQRRTRLAGLINEDRQAA